MTPGSSPAHKSNPPMNKLERNRIKKKERMKDLSIYCYSLEDGESVESYILEVNQ